jgi:hypothetical protein
VARQGVEFAIGDGRPPRRGAGEGDAEMMKIPVFVFLAASLAAQVMPRDAYGVWVRGNSYDVKEFPYRGAEIDLKWEEVQPSEGVFVWTDFDAELKKAASLGLYACIGINVGPMSPAWVYDKGVPKVMTTGHRLRTGPYPYYLDARHIAYYHRLIEEFGRHVRTLPAHLTHRVVFVQVKTGSTGDEAPYKGTPSPAGYAISREQWRDFRLAAFKKFLAAFQKGPGPVIPMLFNAIAYADDPALGEWVEANVKGGWGHKQPGTGQCYQLNDETERVRNLLPHLIDPAPGVSEIFTRCEMDQTWHQGHNIRLHPAMGFYWTALSALHSGLGVWNLTGTARDWCRENNYWEFAHFFNKYAGQTHSPTATGAFCALREGLDAADTEKFPESKFGAASRENRDRYMAICKAYASRGAKMDDPDGVLAGQMNQRFEQKGLNDAGWHIFPGNYERFLHQIDADRTSAGCWRVGGGVSASTPVYARFARGFDHSTGKDAMYFDVKDSFFAGKPLAGAYPVTVRVVYYDQGSGTWALQYDAVGNPRKTAYVVTKTGSGKWKERTVTLRDAYFGNRGAHGADLTLVNMDAEDDIFHMIEVTKETRKP